jgi:hypothetical protein
VAADVVAVPVAADGGLVVERVVESGTEDVAVNNEVEVAEDVPEIC